jgi:hypothetical protein
MKKTASEIAEECDQAFQAWWTLNILKVKKSPQHFPMKQFRMAWNFAWTTAYDQALKDIKGQ